MKFLRVRGITTMSLFIHHCPCGELSVDGFWWQLDKDIDHRRKIAAIKTPCRTCGLVRRKTYRLTTGRAMPPRLLDWINWFFKLAPWLPRAWMQRAAGLALWLEHKAPI